jgi:hypothetical protein
MIFDKDTTEQYESIARNLGMSVAQLLGMEDIPKSDVTWKFVVGEPLIRPEKVLYIPTKM